MNDSRQHHVLLGPSFEVTPVLRNMLIKWINTYFWQVGKYGKIALLEQRDGCLSINPQNSVANHWFELDQIPRSFERADGRRAGVEPTRYDVVGNSGPGPSIFIGKI